LVYTGDVNSLNAKLNPICHLLANPILHISRIGVNILGISVLTIKSTKALVVVSKKIGLDANAGKIKYMVLLEIRMQDEFTI
jgi:hypothetical protein